MFGRSGKLDSAWLRDIRFFADFNDDQLSQVSKLAKKREVAPGEAFIEQGRFGTSCFVVSEAMANVYISDQHVASLGAGQMVGEMAIVDRRPRNASVVAETPMVLVEFGVEEFRKLIEMFPDVNLKVTELLNARLRAND